MRDRSSSRPRPSGPKASGRPSVIVTEAITGSRTPVSLEDLLDGEQAALRLSVSKVVSASRRSTPPSTSGLDLLAVGGHHLVERDGAVAGIVDVAGDRELLVGRADRAGHEAGPVGIPGLGRIGRLAGEPGRGEVHLPRVLLEAEVGHRHAGGPEGVGLDDVAAGLEIGRVDVPDRIGLGEHQDVDAVLQVLGWSANCSPRNPARRGPGRAPSCPSHRRA